MSGIEVRIPRTVPCPIEFEHEGVTGVGIINAGLVDFEPRAVFGWQLSILSFFETLDDAGMPLEADRAALDAWEDGLAKQLRGAGERPNALWFGRITWRGTQELMYRVYQPELADAVVRAVIDSEAQPLPFEYRIDPDEAWSLAQWHLDAVRSAGEAL
ncbi:MAG: hypothetical protein PF961_22130 [Planctomycetota bacterium]|nr:hypothetical protein [Planctomycetota bacterium]